MADYQERLGGGGIASTGRYTVLSGTSLEVAASSGYRLSVEMRPIAGGEVFAAYGAAANATSALPLATGVSTVEPNYLGAINVAASVGASAILAVREVWST